MEVQERTVEEGGKDGRKLFCSVFAR